MTHPDVHDHSHDHDHPHDHQHDHDHPHHHDRPHRHDHHDHDHSHSHPQGGIRGFLYDMFVPHTHDSAYAIDDAMEANAAGVRALKISMFVLLGTTVLQALVVVFTASVALLADTIHNFADALTAVPLWIAFVLARRAVSRRYTYGYGRAEDLAGMFIVFVVALSAVVAGWEAITRFFHPVDIRNAWLLIIAGLIGFAGNEIVAIYRIRVGRSIGSAALMADGVHARLDGFTSLSVVAGAIFVLFGLPIADPVIGLLIAISILILLWGTVRSIGRRLMDGIEPELLARAEHALQHVEGVVDVERLQLRWIGHRLHGNAVISSGATTLEDADSIARTAADALVAALPNLDEVTITPRPAK